MLTMTHSTSLRVSPQVVCSVIESIFVLIIWEMRNANELFIGSEILELTVICRQVRPTCQTKTCWALPMDQMPSGDSSLLNIPPLHHQHQGSVLIIYNPYHSCYQRAFRCMEYRPRIPHCNCIVILIWQTRFTESAVSRKL